MHYCCGNNLISSKGFNKVRTVAITQRTRSLFRKRNQSISVPDCGSGKETPERPPKQQRHRSDEPRPVGGSVNCAWHIPIVASRMRDADVSEVGVNWRQQGVKSESMFPLWINELTRVTQLDADGRAARPRPTEVKGYRLFRPELWQRHLE